MRRLRIDWPEAWYPVADGVLWLRPVDGLAVAPGEGPSPAARLAAGRLPRAEAHGAAWRAALRFGLRKPAGALLGEVVARDGVARASRLGALADGETWTWSADELGAWRVGGVALDRLWPALEPACPPLRGDDLRRLAEGLRSAAGGDLPAELRERLEADAARGVVGRATPRDTSRAGWGPC